MDERNQNEFMNNEEQTNSPAGERPEPEQSQGRPEEGIKNTQPDGSYGSESLNQNYRVENINAPSDSYSSTGTGAGEHANAYGDLYGASGRPYLTPNQDTMTYRVYQESPTNPPEPNKKAKKEKKERKPGSGMTWPKTIAAAVIFGLVAGGAFKGIDIAYNHANGNKVSQTQEEKQTVDNVKQAATVSDNSLMAFDVSDMAESVMPSIVSITTKSVETIQMWFKQYQQEVEGSGSGIIIQQHNNDLYILTNYHVVQGATSLTVGFSDDTMVEAAVKGYNADADLAIVVVDMSKMSSSTVNSIKLATLGDSGNLEVGEAAIAIGNALGYGQSLTGGFISATERILDDSPLPLIQTDAAINPGNSGGALLNAKGEVIGVNSSKLVDSRVEGMGFAIPINKAMELMQGIIDGTGSNVESGGSAPEQPNPYSEYGNGDGGLEDFFEQYFGNGDDQQPGDGDDAQPEVIPSTNKAFLGIYGADITENYSTNLNMPKGVYVTQISNNSPAQKAGLLAGDVITSVDGKDIGAMQDLSSYIGTKNPGDKISITFQRKNDTGTYEEKTVDATLAENESLQ